MINAASALKPPQRKFPVPEGILVEDGTPFAASAAKALKAERDDLDLPDLEVHTVEEFLAIVAANRGLKRAQKITIVKQAILLFKDLYPHLVFKQKIYEFARPLEHLAELLGELGTHDIDDSDFHARMICCFSFVVDPHTTYGLPEPYLGSVAFLPFQIRAYRDIENLPRFVVKRVMRTTGKPHKFFAPGAEITHWNGSVTAFYVENSHGRLPAGNYRARISRGAIFATVRPLAYCLIPADTVATLHYIPPGSKETHAISIPWTIATGMEARNTLPSSTFSVSESTRTASQATHVIVQREKFVKQRLAAGVGNSPFLLQPGATRKPKTDLAEVSALPDVFAFQHTSGKARQGSINPELLRDPGHPNEKFGYIRIFNFGGDTTKGMVLEFRRILDDVMNRHAPDNLIIDIRDNPGGDVNAAEQMLQMLTGGRIDPINFQMANTGSVRGALSELKKLRDQKSKRSRLSARGEVKLTEAVADLRPWIDSIDELRDQDVLGVGRPLTTPEEANAIGRVYRGFVVLLVDAMSFSAADIFASGFQDHLIGIVVGVDPNTGGGGANVWTHEDLVSRLPSSPELDLQPLPAGVTMTLAIRRCARVRMNAGAPLEDVGVQTDVQLDPTSPAEVLDGFVSLIQRTCRMMGVAKHAKLTVRGFAVRTRQGIRVRLDVEGVERLTFVAGGVNVAEIDVKPGPAQTFSVPVPANLVPESVEIGGSVPMVLGHGVTEMVWAASTGLLSLVSER